MNSKLEGALGLSAKAGCVVSGFRAVCQCIEERKAKLVIVSYLLAENTRKKIEKNCSTENVEIIEVKIDDLGLPIGKRNRLVIAITSDSFKKMIKSLI